MDVWKENNTHILSKEVKKNVLLVLFENIEQIKKVFFFLMQFAFFFLNFSLVFALQGKFGNQTCAWIHR